MKLIPWNRERVDELVSLWNKELSIDFPMRKELFIQNSFADVNVLEQGSFIAEDSNGKVIGFVVSKMWQENTPVVMDSKRGWIQVLLVDSEHRGIGIGTSLLKHAEAALIENGAEVLQLAGEPFHYFSGIPDEYSEVQRWFEKFGYYNKINTFDLINHMSKKYPFPENSSASFAVLSIKEKEDFLSFLKRCFPGRWEYEAIKYFEMGGTGREFVVAKKNGNIIGFCRMNDALSPSIAQNVYWSPLFEQEIGGIGPLGIDPKEQKQGYGLEVVEAAMAYLQGRDINTIIIDWTILVEFYEKLDFKPWKKYGIYLKEL
ncbi:Acetyltransferase, GNAT family [Psychrobacillus sp. OK028]|uniref:GNAT family N-acetyltransferase n=1 Tax=Psychrobacillus sp. OK028 TaxID=1884359 RepID=UPI00088A8D29|nr:GNAT family N-acetyltransferase [Psychrobacillus sp. OK028]SDN56831.1 Acetyltransferase, GNAT family [Psychrobacillus sp. OK028]